MKLKCVTESLLTEWLTEWHALELLSQLKTSPVVSLRTTAKASGMSDEFHRGAKEFIKKRI